MKKFFKPILIVVCGFAILYTAGWFYARHTALSYLENGVPLKNGSIEPQSETKGLFSITGFPFGFNITEKGTATYVYTSQSGLNLPITVSDLSVSYHVFAPFNAKFSATVLETQFKDLPKPAKISIKSLKGSAHFGSQKRAKVSVKEIDFGPLKSSCLVGTDTMLHLTSDGKNSHTIMLETATSLKPGCKNLLPSLYQPVLNLLPLKGSRFKTLANIKTHEKEATKMISASLAAKTPEEKPLLSAHTNLQHTRKKNPTDQYDGTLKITLNQVKKAKKKKKQNLFSVVTDVLADSFKDTSGNYVLDFTIKNNDLSPSQGTIQRLTTFVFN